ALARLVLGERVKGVPAAVEQHCAVVGRANLEGAALGRRRVVGEDEDGEHGGADGDEAHGQTLLGSGSTAGAGARWPRRRESATGGKAITEIRPAVTRAT